MNATTHTSLTLEPLFERRTTLSTEAPNSLFLLQGILEGMPDGVMIVAGDGVVVQSNSQAKALCKQLNQQFQQQLGRRLDSHPESEMIPASLSRLCDALLDSRHTFADTPEASSHLAIEDDIELTPARKIRVRVQWLQQESDETRMLVILEDRYQSARRRAIAEGQRYGLSSRESEVWLYRCIGYTYKEIASELFIAIDTVKKHVKSINAKRDRFHCLNC